MKIPPSYEITPGILEIISKIDSYRFFFNSFNLAIPIKEKIQRVSLLKSSLFSARIEGNPLTLEEVESTSNKQKKTEVLNILKAIKYIEKQIHLEDKITSELILFIHKLIMKNLREQGGIFRQEMGAIFNQEGIAVYIPPSPHRIKTLIDQLLNYINNKKEHFPLIKALITHLVFEKIHPFIDGNGRVGRLLTYAVLKSQGYDFGLFIPFEEYLDEHKIDYYYFLDIGVKNTEGYLNFMLNAFLKQLEEIKLEISKLSKKETLLLPPRQEEIFNIIRDHTIVSFDFIRRRFLKIPTRTLRYDLKKLVDAGFVLKIGKTKGSYYKVV